MPNFSSQTPNRGLTRLNMQQQAHQQLLQDAFSLTPDVDAVTKAILDKKLYSADSQLPMKEVNGIVGDYMEKFNKDPFYAFSREGRKAAQNLKAIVNHPSIKEWEQNASLADDEYKRASGNRVNKNVVVSGNDVLAIKDGKRQHISINDLSKLDPRKGDRLLDVDSDMQYTRNVAGVREGVPSYDMSKLDDIEQKVSNAFSGLGSTENEWVQPGGEEGVNTKLTRKSNEAQLKMAIKTLMTTGLTEADRNTLKSEYIKSHGNAVSSQGFNSWLSDKLSGVATGKLSTLRSDIPVKAIGEGGVGVDKKAYELTPAHLIFTNKTGNRRVENSNLGTGQSLQGNLLPLRETLDASARKSADGYASRTPIDNKIFSEATDLANLSVISRGKNGDWVKMPGLARHGVIVDRPEAQPAMVYQYTYDDVNGKPSVVPTRISEGILERQDRHMPFTPEQEKYLTTRTLPDGKVQKGLASKPWIDFSMLLPRPRGIWGNSGVSGEALELGKQAKELGYESFEDSRAEEYYGQYSGKQGAASDIDPSGPWHPGSVADEFYEVKARVPLISSEQLNSAYGGHSVGNREDVDISTSGLIDNYHVLSSNSFSVPNQTKVASKVPSFKQIQ